MHVVCAFERASHSQTQLLLGVKKELIRCLDTARKCMEQESAPAARQGIEVCIRKLVHSERTHTLRVWVNKFTKHSWV